MGDFKNLESTVKSQKKGDWKSAKKTKKNLIANVLIISFVICFIPALVFGLSLVAGLVGFALVSCGGLILSNRKLTSDDRSSIEQVAAEVERYGDRFANSGKPEEAQAAMMQAQRIRSFTSIDDAIEARSLYLGSIGVAVQNQNVQSRERFLQNETWSDNS